MYEMYTDAYRWWCMTCMQSPFNYSFGHGRRAAGGMPHPSHILVCAYAGSSHPKKIFLPCTSDCIYFPQCWSRGTSLCVHYDGFPRLFGDWISSWRCTDIVVVFHYAHHYPCCRNCIGSLGLLLPLSFPFLWQNLASVMSIKLWALDFAIFSIQAKLLCLYGVSYETGI